MLTNYNPEFKPWWRATAGYYTPEGVPGYKDEQEAFVQGIVRSVPVQGAGNQLLLGILSNYVRGR